MADIRATVSDLTYPATPVQEGILFQAVSLSAAAYQLQAAFEVSAAELPAFRQAWEHLVARHDILRSHATDRERASPELHVVERADLLWQDTDLSGPSTALRDTQWRALCAAELSTPIDVHRPPLMRFVSARVDSSTAWVLWTCHHLIMDGWSLAVLIRELEATFDALLAGGAPELPEPVRFSTYATWLRRTDSASAVEFWQSYLRNAIPTVAPGYAASAQVLSPRFDGVQISFSEDVSERVSAAARAHHTTPSVLAHAAWALVLGRFTGSRDVLFGTNVLGRSAPLAGIDRMIGPVLNTLPFRVNLSASARSRATLLRDVHAGYTRLLAFEHASLARLAALMRVPRGMLPFESLLSCWYVGAARQWSRLRLLPLEGEERTELPVLAMLNVDRPMSLRLSYRSDLIVRSVMETVGAAFEEALDWCASERTAPRAGAHPRRVDGREPAPESVRGAAGLSLDGLVERAAARTPERDAIVDATGSVAFAQLIRRADDRARQMHERGVRPEDLVVTDDPLCASLLVDMLGAMRAGAAVVLRADSTLLGRVSGAERDALATERDANPAASRDHRNARSTQHAAAAHGDVADTAGRHPEQLAYVVATGDGSLGRSTGTSHRAAAARAGRAARAWTLDATTTVRIVGDDQRLAVVALAALAAGSTVHIGSVAQLPRATVLVMRAEVRVDVREDLPRADRIVLLGEEVPPSLGRAATDRAEIALMSYGSDECGEAAAVQRIAADGTADVVTFDDGAAYVLDHDLDPVPLGAVGDLYLAGPTLAREYRRRAADTAAAFVPDPFASTPGQRMLRTHTRAQHRGDGTVRLVSTRNESSAARMLSLHPAVRAVTQPARNAPALVAVLAGGMVADARALAHFVQERVPEVRTELAISLRSDVSALGPPLPAETTDDGGTSRRADGVSDDRAAASRLARVPRSILAPFLAELAGTSTRAHVPAAAAGASPRKAAEPPTRTDSINAFIDASVATRTGAVAIEFGTDVVSYEELDARARTFAALVTARGVGPEAIVAVRMRRSPLAVAAILGILRAGAAYLPLDVALPPQRVQQILAAAMTTLAIADADLMESLSPGVAGIAGDAPAPTGSPSLPAAPAPRNAAYVLFTSGTTGTPKGVTVEHRSVANFVCAINRAYEISAQDRVLQFAPLGFDVSVFEIFCALAAGATLCIAGDDERRDPVRLQHFLRERRITVAELPPALLPLLDPAGLPELRLVSVGGEAFPGSIVGPWSEGRRFVNGYGPSETTVACTLMDCAGTWDDMPPIGVPFGGHRTYVLDAGLREVTPGTPGELYVAGPGLARGYFNLPGETGARFRPDPFNGVGERMYATGDRVRTNPDGTLQFLGRVDRQVKVRGNRVELAEVEAALMRHPTIAWAGVDATTRDGQTRLEAVLVPAEGYAVDGDAIMQFLAERLPDYMLPTTLAVASVVRIGPSGKADRTAIRRAATAIETHQSYDAPGTATEARVASIVANVLGAPQVSVSADFFRSGGTSLQAMQVLARVRDAFGADLDLAAFFLDPTVGRLAGLVDDHVARTGVGASRLGELLAYVERLTDVEAARLLRDGTPE